MPPRLLLLGAGFSYPWGGWLADEVFAYLLGCFPDQRHNHIRELLWQHQEGGNGFEGTLAKLKAECAGKEPSADLRLVNNAVRDMFADMNRGFLNEGSVLFSAELKRLLASFDIIFTLNQDLLLERHYVFADPASSLPEARKGKGAVLAGVAPDDGFIPQHLDRAGWEKGRWLVGDDLPKFGRPQPIIKLHGSSHWFKTSDPNDLMVIGGDKKEAIDADPLLKAYHACFAAALLKPGARLMIIGYSFSDPHINAAIVKAAEDNALRTFIVDPQGANVLNKCEPVPRAYLRKSLIGLSRRPLSELVDPTRAEHSKVVRFLADS